MNGSSLAERSIAYLDQFLARVGEDITFQRFAVDGDGVQTITYEATCRAKVTGGGAPQELVPMPGEAANTKIIMSPTGLIAAGWPGLPVKDDRVLIGGVANNVEIVDPTSIDNRIVRLDLQVRT